MSAPALIFLQFSLLELLGILGNDEVVDAVLNVTVHEGRQVVDGVANAVVGDATLGVIVGANLCRAVAGAH